MGEVTKIAWCDHTFNPWIGCTRVSPGCQNCYAERQNKLHKFNGGGWGPGTTRKVTSEANWKQLARWDAKAALAGERRRVFVASLADVFDREAPVTTRWRLWCQIDLCPHLEFLLLTKRPENWAAMLPSAWLERWPSNVRLGFTAEDQTRLEERLAHAAALRSAHPAVPMLFVSYEPAVGPIDLILSRAFEHVNWVICGGESGPGARPMLPEWARDVRDECQVAGVPFFFKQWGDYPRAVAGSMIYDEWRHAGFDLTAHTGGHQLDGETWQQFPAALSDPALF